MSDNDYDNNSYDSDQDCRKEQHSTCFGPYVIVPSINHPATSIIRENKIRKQGDQAMLSVNTGEGSSNFYAVPIMDQELIAVTDGGQAKVKIYKACNMGFCRDVCVDDGPFHMWYNQSGCQLWVTCVQAKTVNVICTKKWKVIKKICLPSDLSEEFNFHDVTITQCGAVVTLNGSSSIGYVLKYSTCSFKERARLQVLSDPHVLSFGQENDFLYVAAQGGKVYKVNPKKLTICKEVDFVGAHGLWLSNDRQRLFVANITSSDGVAAIGVFDTKKLTLKYSIDSVVGKPHNLILSQDNCVLYITHTGKNRVTVHYLKKHCAVKEVKVLTPPPGPMGISRYPLDLSYECEKKCEKKCERKCEKKDCSGGRYY